MALSVLMDCVSGGPAGSYTSCRKNILRPMYTFLLKVEPSGVSRVIGDKDVKNNERQKS